MRKSHWYLLAGLAFGSLLPGSLPVRVVLDKPRAQVTETTYLPGVPRQPGVRHTDQIIVFLDDCTYERKDPSTGAVTIRTRKAGEVLWHDKGEAAPQLINKGNKPYRTLTIALP